MSNIAEEITRRSRKSKTTLYKIREKANYEDLEKFFKAISWPKNYRKDLLKLATPQTEIEHYLSGNIPNVFAFYLASYCLNFFAKERFTPLLRCSGAGGILIAFAGKRGYSHVNCLNEKIIEFQWDNKNGSTNFFYIDLEEDEKDLTFKELDEVILDFMSKIKEEKGGRHELAKKLS